MLEAKRMAAGIQGMHEVECVVIGAGVIGLAIARALALGDREVVVLERERAFGTQTSSHNSEVIHAGIYYAPGSLKAAVCVAGRELLYRYLEERGVAHRRCGKLIVAAGTDQLPQLDALQDAARANGVHDLQRLDAAQACRLEPGVSCAGALLSPSTGILDGHAYMLSLLGDAERRGATVAYGAAVAAITPTRSGFEITLTGDAAAGLRARVVINSAGLDAQRVAAATLGFPAQHIPALHLAKGSYFTLSGAAPFTRLIYPVPEIGGLGTHLTLDLAGRARFGPDVEWVDSVDYDVDATRAERFYAAIRRYWPGLRDGQLQPAYAGVRPKLSGPGQPAADFCIAGPAAHGIAGLVHLFGMESPGLTASLSVAQRVAELV